MSGRSGAAPGDLDRARVVAQAVIERDPVPATWLDRPGRVRLANAAFLALAGLGQGALGKLVFDLVSEADAPAARLLHERALGGADVREERDLTLHDGRRLRMLLESRPWGQGADAGVLLRVVGWRTLTPPPAAPLPPDLDYEISGTIREFGLLRRVVWPGGALEPQAVRDRLCHELLRGRASPCPDCPALAGAGAWPRASATAEGGGYRVVTAALAGDGIRVRVRSLSEEAVGGLVDARVAVLAERFVLSPREAEVLRCLLLGRAAAEIASMLHIAPRTAKHHQQALLRKIGVDSRAALLRLVV